VVSLPAAAIIEAGNALFSQTAQRIKERVGLHVGLRLTLLALSLAPY
jgi:hypothetical protein